MSAAIPPARSRTGRLIVVAGILLVIPGFLTDVCRPPAARPGGAPTLIRRGASRHDGPRLDVRPHRRAGETAAGRRRSMSTTRSSDRALRTAAAPAGPARTPDGAIPGSLRCGRRRAARPRADRADGSLGPWPKRPTAPTARHRAAPPADPDPVHPRPLLREHRGAEGRDRRRRQAGRQGPDQPRRPAAARPTATRSALKVKVDSKVGESQIFILELDYAGLFLSRTSRRTSCTRS